MFSLFLGYAIDRQYRTIFTFTFQLRHSNYKLTHTARISLENQRSNAHLIVTKTQTSTLEHRYATAKKAVADIAGDIVGKISANVEIDDISALRMSAKKAFDFTDQSTQQTHKMAFKKPVAARRKRRGRRGLIKKPVS